MSKCWILLSILSVLMVSACSGDDSNQSGPGRNGAGAGGGGGNSGNGSGGFGNGIGNGGTGVMTTADGGILMADPTMRAFLRDDTATSGIDTATVTALKMGGTACTAAMVYPYEGTVFPRGLPAPTMMWNGGGDAAYVHMRYEAQDNVDYQFAVAGATELVIPQDAWDKIVARSSMTALKVTFTVMSGGALSTCDAHWTIAPGTLTGAVYYNTYNAPGAMFPNQGAIMRLTLGDKESKVYLQDPAPKNGFKGTGPCISCHSLSFDGSTIVASRHDYGGNGLAKIFSFQVSSYPVTADVQPTALSPIPSANFGGLFPDGKRMITMGNPQCTNGAETFPRAPNNFMMVEGPNTAKTVDTATGKEVPATGMNKDWYMWMPQFSPDGKHVVFNHAKPDGAGGTDRRELAIMDYDYATNTFSNLKVIASKLGATPDTNYAPAPTLAGTITESCTPALAGGAQTATLTKGACSGGPCYPGWPFFTPDSRGVVFLLTDQPDFASAFPGRTTPTKGELWYADVDSGQTVQLTKANAGPKAEDAQHNFYPTVVPVAIGGYFWVFWTSKRDYGNKVYPELQKSDTYALSTGFAEMDAQHKRIWVTALKPIAQDAEFPMGLQDISSPGFFLTGQSESGNVRAFTTLNPCVKEGETCKSGLDCCSGFCFIPPDELTEFDVEPVGHCTDEPPVCSKTNDACKADSDCCPPAAGQPKNTCIGGFCAFIANVD